MSDTTRVQRWREAKRQNGLQAVTVWLTTSEELRLKDAAVQERCSPSDVMQRAFAQYQARNPSSISTVPDTSLIQVLIQDALAQWQPPTQSGISNGTDTSLLREMIREELAAMHDIVSPMGTASVTVTDAVPIGDTMSCIAASSVRIISRSSDISVSLPILDWIGGCHCARAS